MRGAIASVEVWIHPGAAAKADDSSPRRLTLVVGSPERDVDSGDWTCRVALADLHRPETIRGADSVGVLARAMSRASEWLTALEEEGTRLTRDRAGSEAFALRIQCVTDAQSETN